MRPFREYSLICLEEADTEMDLFVQMIQHGFQLAAVFSVEIDEATEGEESELSTPSFSDGCFFMQLPRSCPSLLA